MSDEASPAGAVRAQRVAAGVICVLLAFCLATGFFVSWDALQVAAKAAHASPNATRAYAFCVDGVIAIALAASVVLRHVPGSRRYSLRILGLFSASSLVLNMAHGLGAFESKAPWPLLALTAANAPAAIGFGSHLFVKTLQVLFPSMDGTVEPIVEAVPVPDAAPVPAVKPSPVPAKAVAKPSSVKKTAPKKTAVKPSQDETVDEVLVRRARHFDDQYQQEHGRPIPRDTARPLLGVSNEKTGEALRLAREGVAS